MKRSELVEKLIIEGFSEKTLVNFSDKQLNSLAQRILGEAITTTAKALSQSADLQNLAKKQDIKLVGEDGEVSEELKGKQKNLDKNHNGKIDGQDFKILKGQKKEKKKEGVDIKEWVGALAEENFHSFTSKNEIMELIKVKINENQPAPSKPTRETPVREKPSTKPEKPSRENPFEPKHKPKPKALDQPAKKMGTVEIPDYLTFDQLKINFKDQ